MVRKINERIDVKLLVLILVVIILVIINLILFTKKFLQPKVADEKANGTVTIAGHDEKKSEEVALAPRTDEEVIKMLSGYKERDRMEYYCSVFFKHLENHEYEDAYNLLYPEFKENYFPTEKEFEEYVKKTYPSEWALIYDDITRQGNIYVLRLKILDVLGSKENEKIQRVVIRENNFNDYVISFQVI